MTISIISEYNYLKLIIALPGTKDNMDKTETMSFTVIGTTAVLVSNPYKMLHIHHITGRCLFATIEDLLNYLKKKRKLN